MPFAPKAHPRLLFDARELAVLRQEAQSGFKAQVLGTVLDLCERLMTPDDLHYFDFRERESDMWRHRAGIFRVLPSLNLLSIGYAFSGDTRLGDCARDALLTIISEGLADVQSINYGCNNVGWRHGPGHDKGKFALTAAWLYDFCHDRFSEDQRALVACYAEESIHLASEHGRFDANQIANNRGTRGLLSTALWSLALEGESATDLFMRCIDAAPRTIDAHLAQGFDPDGAPYEGPGYSQGILAFMALTAEMLRQRGGPDLTTNPRFERHLEYLLYQLLPGGGSVNNLNDAREPCGSVLGCLHLLSRNQNQNQNRVTLIPWLASQLDFHPTRSGWLEGAEVSLDLFDNMHPLMLLLWWKDDAPVRTPQELGMPVSRSFPTRGVVSMRTGWGPDDWLLSHFCGRQEAKCHSQGDQNHVAFYAAGERFLVDAGYGNPIADPTKALDRWFSQTSAHNCVMIDDAEQRIGAHGRMLEFTTNDLYDCSLGDAADCTGIYYVRRSQRRVVLVRGDVPFVVILDVNEKDGALFKAQCRWTTDASNSIEVGESHFVIKGRSAQCHAAVLWPCDAEVRLAESGGRPQLRVSASAAVCEMVTAFCPVTSDAPGWPCFSCSRQGEGQFEISCERDGRSSQVSLRIS